MKNNLPQGWEEIELSEITNYKKGKKPKKMQAKFFEDGLVYLDIKAIEKGNDEIFVDRESSNFTDENDLIVVWDGARAGWVAKSRTGAIGSTLMSLTPKIDKDFLFRLLQTKFNYLQSNHRGTGIPHVDPAIFWSIKIPIAPLPEQKRIVAKLDAIMQKIDSNKQRLEKIPKLSKRFRQSVLAAAVQGKLTHEWREKQDFKETAFDFINRIKSKTSEIQTYESDLPEDWINIKIGDAFVIERGSSPRPKKDDRYFAKERTLFHWIMLSDFTDNTKNDVLIDTNEFLTKEGIKYSRYVNQNDILVGVSGVYGVGRTCLLDIEGYIYDGIMVIKNIQDADARKFIHYFMLLQRMKFLDVATGTSWPNINTSILKEYFFPFPPPEEQKEIVRRVEQLFAFADKIELRYTKTKTIIDKLPQSILAKAFLGELVPQNPNDEPASVLLARIKKEKEKLIEAKKNKNVKQYKIEDEPLTIAAEKKVRYQNAKNE